jgi:hypothetical protein
MSFDDERLRILERVSNGELTPQEGSLEITMLKVKYQQETEAHQAASQEVQSGGGFRDRFRFARPPEGFKLSWPLVVGLAIPFLFVAGALIAGMGLMLALPALAVTMVWNAVASTSEGAMPLLSFWPTLGVMILVSALSSLLGFRRRIRLFTSAGPRY